MRRIVCILLTCVMVMASCRTTKDITTEKEYIYKTDTLYKSLLVQDSIYVRDSIVLREKGDTVFSEKWHVKYIERLRTDTLYKVKTDSIYLDKVVVKEKQMTRMERVWMFMKDVGLVIMVLAVIALVWFIRKKFFGGWK